MHSSISPSPDLPVLIIGAAGVDVVGRLRGELHNGTSNPARIRTTFGGVARNVAENLIKLGQPATLLTAVGEDKVGEQLLHQITSVGVDTHAALRNPKYPTGTYLGVLNSRGRFQFALDDMRVVSAISPDYLKAHQGLFREASWLFVDSNLPKETLRTAFSLARRAKLPVCADPTSAALAPKLLPFLPRLHLILPNQSEAGVLSGQAYKKTPPDDGLETAKHLVNQGVDVVIISQAEAGVCYATSEISGHIPAIRTEIVDPTGAGDALTAAVIFSLLNDIPIDDAVRLGVAAASLTLQHPGAVIPDLSLQKLYDHW